MNQRFKLASKLALREMRTGLSGFRILITCLVLGVAVIAGVGSLFTQEHFRTAVKRLNPGVLPPIE